MKLGSGPQADDQADDQVEQVVQVVQAGCRLITTVKSSSLLLERPLSLKVRTGSWVEAHAALDAG